MDTNVEQVSPELPISSVIVKKHPKFTKKRLIVLLSIVLVLLAAAGAGAWYLHNKRKTAVDSPAITEEVKQAKTDDAEYLTKMVKTNPANLSQDELKSQLAESLKKQEQPRFQYPGQYINSAMLYDYLGDRPNTIAMLEKALVATAKDPAFKETEVRVKQLLIDAKENKILQW